MLIPLIGKRTLECERNFQKLCDELRPFITGKETSMVLQVSAETKILLTPYYLSDAGRMRKTANAFGIGKSTVSKIVQQVSTVIRLHLGPNLLHHPSSENEVKEMAENFLKFHGFPQCIGAVDGTHIYIKSPRENASDFIKRKGRHSINVQACVDYRFCFFDAVVRWPGSVHDARIWSNSSINESLKSGAIPLCPKEIVLGESPVNICILGDPAYPLLPYLMKEFTAGGNTVEEQFLCYRLSSARMVVECAFGRLEERFGILGKEMDTSLNNTLNIIYACFVLHNFCEINKESMCHNTKKNLNQKHSQMGVKMVT